MDFLPPLPILVPSSAIPCLHDFWVQGSRPYLQAIPPGHTSRPYLQACVTYGRVCWDALAQSKALGRTSLATWFVTWVLRSPGQLATWFVTSVLRSPGQPDGPTTQTNLMAPLLKPT
eukprot:364346-Chlamydomonas_euryale.AAC.1